MAASTEISMASLFTPELIADPYPTYRHLREQHPVLQVPGQLQGSTLWLLTRYQDMAELLKDKRFGHLPDPAMSPKERDEMLATHVSLRSLAKTMLLVNPPEHTRLRSLVVKAFNARAVEVMRPKIRSLVNQLLDSMKKTNGGDLVKLFNYPLPVLVICDILGIPAEDQQQFMSNARVAGRIIDPTPMSEAELADADANILTSQDYFEGLFEKRRHKPKDDLLTALVQSENEYGKLSAEELAANVLLLFGAGHETTANLLGNALLALYRNPEQLQLLRQKPQLMPIAVEEFLRYDSSVQLTARSAQQDVDFKGHHFAKGSKILLLVGAANRDPEQFERPEELDIERADGKYLSFGGGIHFCLGAQLARIEAVEALRLIFQRLPDLHIKEIAKPEWKSTITLRGLANMEATW